MKKSVLLLVVMSVLALLAAPVVAQDEFVFGLVLVGP